MIKGILAAYVPLLDLQRAAHRARQIVMLAFEICSVEPIAAGICTKRIEHAGIRHVRVTIPFYAVSKVPSCSAPDTRCNVLESLKVGKIMVYWMNVGKGHDFVICLR